MTTTRRRSVDEFRKECVQQKIKNMPVIKSAIKKLRQDRKKEKQNDQIRELLKSAIRAAKKAKTGKSVTTAISKVDKAAKLNIIHENKAARLKSSLSKLAKPVRSKVADKTVDSKPSKKAPAKASKSTTPKKKAASK